MQALASCNALIVALQHAAEVCCQGVSQAVPLSTALLQLLHQLQPLECASGKSLSSATVLTQLRGLLPSGVLQSGQEHDAAEALELLLQCVAAEMRQAFLHSPSSSRNELLARGTLNAVLQRPAESDPLLAAWRAISSISSMKVGG